MEINIPDLVWLLLGLVVIGGAGIVAWFFYQSQKVSLTGQNAPGEKPEWMATEPPQETRQATAADNEGVTVYDYDEGEKVAAPFAEQIEDVLNALLRMSPGLAAVDIDLGTAPDGELEIWINGERYSSVDEIPDPRIREAFQLAIEKWQDKRAS